MRVLTGVVGVRGYGDGVLDEMRIQGLGVIDDAVLELGPGFTVVTGETGAGKTMIVQGLSLLLGGRADGALIRSGASRAVVEGRVRVDPTGPVAARAKEAGADLDDDDLIVTRQVSAEGRSRAFLGGTSVPVGVLSEIAEALVAVHGQSDQQRLLRPAVQRTALDRFAGTAVARPLDGYAAAYRRLAELRAQLAGLEARARERAQEADLVRFGLAEVAAVAPQPGEDITLAVEVRRLAHADALGGAATSAHEILAGEPSGGAGADVLTSVAQARRALENVGQHDPLLAELVDRVAEAGFLLADAASGLSSYLVGLETDPVRLAAAQDRQAALGGLFRKYGGDVAAVLGWVVEAERRLAELAGADDRAADLRAEEAAVEERLAALAGRLSRARARAAATFSRAVTAELTELAMPHAALTVEVSQQSADDGLLVEDRLLAYGPTGVDDVEIMLTPHTGAAPRPVAKGASGGELSRVMLAVEVVLAGADPVPTFVFDEVDAGVGGRAAVEIGHRLARLALTAQVIVVTHLPQVAAFADRHLVVRKSDDGRVTSSGVTTLDAAGRVRELSRMLAGLETSTLAQGHAEELLATAAEVKATG